MQRFLLAVAFLPLIACATATSGRHEELRITSSPAAAEATLSCNGSTVGSSPTPATFKIRRNAGDCAVKLTKVGFDDATISIEQGVNPAYWMNMLFSPLAPAGAYLGILGTPEEKVIGLGAVATAVVVFGTDFWTGAVHAHKPNTVDVVMKPKRVTSAE